MAYRVTNDLDIPSNMKLSRLSTPSQIGNFIKNVVKALEFEYHETEVLEVKTVVLNNVKERGSVRGIFHVSKTDPGIVRPLMPYITAVPVVGEDVLVVQYGSKYYYISIINTKSSVNENSIPGMAGGYDANAKYGDYFQKQNTKLIELKEGSTLYEGRFGQSIHFDHSIVTAEDESTSMSPVIKIRANHDITSGRFVVEDINEDDSSIYLISNGLRNRASRGGSVKFKMAGEEQGEEVVGKKVLINSNGIFINGTDNVKINGLNSIKLKTTLMDINSNEVNINSDKVNIGGSEGQPVVLGDDLKNILQKIITSLNQLSVGLLASPIAPNVTTFTSGVVNLQTELMQPKKLLSTKVKTI
jgi:translation initiation factor 1 (eIF-1/SUI1)